MTEESTGLPGSPQEPTRDEYEAAPCNDSHPCPFEPLDTSPLQRQHRFSISILALIFACLPVALPLWPIFGLDNTDFQRPCAPPIDGTSKMTDKLAFLSQITPITGRLSFGAVRAIDVAWKIVVGRGGPALLIWISYRVYWAYLFHAMESTSVPNSLDGDLELEKPSLTWMWTTTELAFQRNQVAKHKILMIWLLSTLTWVLAWQIFTHAMVGYIRIGVPCVAYSHGFPDGQTMPLLCETSGNKYVWGISPYLTISFVLINAVWVFGIYATFTFTIRVSSGRVQLCEKLFGQCHFDMDTLEALQEENCLSSGMFSDNKSEKSYL